MRDSETEMVNEMNKAEDIKSYNKDEEREISLSSPASLALICVLQTEQNQPESIKQKRKEKQSVYIIIWFLKANFKSECSEKMSECL